MSETFVERAPAKVNLTLHIIGRRNDGWHELESLVAFTRSGDTLSLTPDAALCLTIDGPTAAHAGELGDNLVLRAAQALKRRVDGLRVGVFHLVKRLPVASGIGGGSSDAAAALRLLARVNAIAFDDPRLTAAAVEIGADVPVCLAASARVMTGIGETLGPRLDLPPLPALIVNPGVSLQTKAVFARMDLPLGWRSNAGAHPLVVSGAMPDSVWSSLRRARNDMEDAACVLAPVVSDVLAVLGAAPGCRLARMSGSGATCFGLFTDCRAAGRAKIAIRRAHPEWWLRPVMLG